MALIGISRKKDKAAQKAAPLPTEVDKDTIFVTEAASRAILDKAREEDATGQVFRVGIMGGGCSGLTYHFSWTDTPKDTDKVLAVEGAQVCIDPKSLKLLGGTILDFNHELGREGFVMKNPNAKSSCSCGESFSI